MNKDEKIQKILYFREEIDRLVHEKYHSLTKKYGLTLEQFHLLIELDELMIEVEDDITGPTVGEIAKNINNSQNTVSEKVSRLENKGLVTRIRDKNDRRVSRVVLTEEGRKLISSMDEEASNDFIFDSLRSLNEIDIDNLMCSLKKLLQSMKL